MRFKATSHRLCHTYATQLVNAGCKITTIQALLGHKHLNTTMTYARVHDHTVAEDYFAAMSIVEKRLEGQLQAAPTQPPNANGDAPQRSLALVESLDMDNLDAGQCAALVKLRRGLLAFAA